MLKDVIILLVTEPQHLWFIIDSPLLVSIANQLLSHCSLYLWNDFPIHLLFLSTMIILVQIPISSHFWTSVLEMTLESPLDSKEVKLVNLKGNQSWILIGRTDAEAEASILWPPDVKNWLIGKDPDAGKDWRQEEKGMTEDEMVGWHHWFNRHWVWAKLSLSKLQEIVKDKEAWCAAVHSVCMGSDVVIKKQVLRKDTQHLCCLSPGHKSRQALWKWKNLLLLPWILNSGFEGNWQNESSRRKWNYSSFFCHSINDIPTSSPERKLF